GLDPWLPHSVTPAVVHSSGPDERQRSIPADPGLMVWLQRELDPEAGLVTKVRGFRHGVRGPLANDTTFVFNDHELLNIVPDRPPGTDITVENDGLHLANGGTVAIADATYGDVIILGKTHSVGLPGIKLGSSFVVGVETDCA